MYALSLMPNSIDQFGSRSRLVIVAAQRARQLMQGARPSIVSKHTQPSTIALEEVLNGTVKYVVGKEARDGFKHARKQREIELARLTVERAGPVDPAQIKKEADALEIKKDLSVVVDDSQPADTAAAEW
jgi:DNA-directed RNA polymerase subunit omega